MYKVLTLSTSTTTYTHKIYKNMNDEIKAYFSTFKTSNWDFDSLVPILAAL